MAENEPLQPEIQLIANVVIVNPEGHVLLVRRDPDDDRWWLPGGDLLPYQHPDDRARDALQCHPGLAWDTLRMAVVESFRGRRGWHVMFDYYATGSGIPSGDLPAAWFPPDAFPRTMHGRHERETVRKVLETATCGAP